MPYLHVNFADSCHICRGRCRCKQVADLGNGAHNLATFNRWGRFLALAGFGNLPGDLALFERKDTAKWKQINSTRQTPIS